MSNISLYFHDVNSYYVIGDLVYDATTLRRNNTININSLILNNDLNNIIEDGLYFSQPMHIVLVNPQDIIGDYFEEEILDNLNV